MNATDFAIEARLRHDGCMHRGRFEPGVGQNVSRVFSFGTRTVRDDERADAFSKVGQPQTSRRT